MESAWYATLEAHDALRYSWVWYRVCRDHVYRGVKYCQQFVQRGITFTDYSAAYARLGPGQWRELG